MSNPINGGVGQWDKNSDLEWRLKQMQDDMNFMWSRLDELERNRDEKIDPYDKRDAGEPANRYFVDCLKENAKLVEENDVLRYQYEAMKNETVRCKVQLDQFEKIVKEQAINKCIDIVERIKNDPLTVGDGIGHRWMVAICEDILQAIKKEFGVK